MFKLSTKARYGSRLMLDLASRRRGEPVFLREIAESQELSPGYLEQIVLPLKVSGLISSSRGSKGGYMLARDPKRITLQEIVQAVEGSLSPVECIDAPAVCGRVQDCVMRDVWRDLGESIRKNLGSVTLQDMLKRKEKKKLKG